MNQSIKASTSVRDVIAVLDFTSIQSLGKEKQEQKSHKNVIKLERLNGPLGLQLIKVLQIREM